MLMEDAHKIPGMNLMGAIDLLRPGSNSPVEEDPDEGVQQLTSFMAGVQRK